MAPSTAQQLQGKNAVITGSARGIGQAIARRFAINGANVVICSRTEEASRKVADELASHGVKTLAYGADVASTAATEAMLKDVLDKWGSIDVLVNNAGVTRDNLLLRMKEDDWDTVLATNLKSAYNACRVASRAMMKAQRGSIINISSVVGIMGNPGQANYAASKAGLIGFTKALARELASRNITVNCIAPGYIETDMTAALTPEQREKIQSQIPLGRLGGVEDIAQAAVFLASDLARYITGQTIVVDGGLTM